MIKEENLVAAPSSASTRGVIIVGPGKHFGIELVRRFATAGYQIGVVSLREASLIELQRATGAEVLTAVADVGDSDAFAQALRNMAGQMHSVDGLIYNPKASVKATALATDPADLHTAMAVNVTGAMVAVQTLLPWLEPRGGAVVLTGGGYKDEPALDKFALSIGKATLHALYRSLSQPLQRKGVRMKTVVIDGSVRSSDQGIASSARLADFYLSIFEAGNSRVHRFPRDVRRSDQLALTF